MKKSRQPKFPARAFTLLEMSVVIMVLLALMSTGMFVSSKMTEWQLGRAASETLRQVYSAQRMFLADNPTRSVSSITSADLLPYFPSGTTSMPTVTSLSGSQLGILVNVSPPVINTGTGVAYDPSGSNRDSLWDIGE